MTPQINSVDLAVTLIDMELRTGLLSANSGRSTRDTAGQWQSFQN